MTIKTAVLVTLGFALVCCSSEGFDFSRGKFDTLEVHLLRRFVPISFQNSLDSNGYLPKYVGWFVTITRFVETPSDTADSRFLIFCVDSRANGLLRLIGPEEGDWRILAETDSVVGETYLGADFKDLDCDGKNEIVLSYSTGAAGFLGLQVVKFESGLFHVITPIGSSEYITGRTIDLVKSDSDCGWEIQVTQDGPAKYEPDTLQIYRLDPATRSFRMISSEKISPSK
jgi:hypothetical protein